MAISQSSEGGRAAGSGQEARSDESGGGRPFLEDVHEHSPMKMTSDPVLLDLMRKAHPPKVDGSTLIAAAETGAVEVVRRALESGVDLLSENRYGSPALLVAAAHGHPEVVRALLDHGADPNTATKSGSETALTAAVCGSNVEAVRMLIAAGADVNCRRTFDNGTPAAVAEWLGQSQIARLLREAGGKG